MKHHHGCQLLRKLLCSKYRNPGSSFPCMRISTQSHKQPPHVCIVGSGPAGFYTAQQILKGHPTAKVDIYDKLPIPFGLVRFGVAPDHPEVKNVIHKFSTTANDDRCSFLGGVDVGKDILLKDLQQCYTAVVLCYGASEDQSLNIPGEALRGVHSARSFVGWYNGLPQDKGLNPDLSCDTAVIIGMGNVALDVARILLTPISVLEKTDICQHALDVLSRSTVKKVHICGRRGPLQAAFTIKEFREMIKLPNCRTVLDRATFEELQDCVKDLPRPKKRITELMIKTATGEGTECSSTKTNEWYLKCLRSPVEILSDRGGTQVSGIRLSVNKLERASDNQLNAVTTDTTEVIPCGLVLRSIGYRSVPLETGLPFNNKTGTVSHDNGRISGLEGVYCSGWLKTGPTGVILTTMTDGFDTGKLVIDDLKNNKIEVKVTHKGKETALDILKKKGVRVVTFKDWEDIDKEEVKRGEAIGKPREKITDVQEMLKIVH